MNAEKFNDVFEFQDPTKRLRSDLPPDQPTLKRARVTALFSAR